MSNGESKIAIFKVRLCYGFAIALRALFLGILCLLIASRKLAMTHPLPPPQGRGNRGATKMHALCHCEHSQECVASNRVGILCLLIAALVALARNDPTERHCEHS